MLLIFDRLVSKLRLKNVHVRVLRLRVLPENAYARIHEIVLWILGTTTGASMPGVLACGHQWPTFPCFDFFAPCVEEYMCLQDDDGARHTKQKWVWEKVCAYRFLSLRCDADGACMRAVGAHGETAVCGNGVVCDPCSCW